MRVKLRVVIRKDGKGACIPSVPLLRLFEAVESGKRLSWMFEKESDSVYWLVLDTSGKSILAVQRRRKRGRR